MPRAAQVLDDLVSWLRLAGVPEDVRVRCISAYLEEFAQLAYRADDARAGRECRLTTKERVRYIPNTIFIKRGQDAKSEKSGGGC